MKKEQTIAQFLNVTNFPFEIKDKNGKLIYLEYSDGYWFKREYNDRGNTIYSENSDGHWFKRECDEKGKEIRFEDSDGVWAKSEYDEQGNEIYYENSDGYIVDNRPKPMIELTLQDIAKIKGVSVSQIRIKE
jgi:hypothetical protein